MVERFFDTLSARLATLWRCAPAPTGSRNYRCLCERPVFFRNSECLACHTPLGYEPERAQVLPLVASAAPGDEGAWHIAEAVRPPSPEQPDEAPPARAASPQRYGRCGNLDATGCNWLVPLAEEERAGDAPLCLSCRLNRTIPDLTQSGSDVLWRRTEVAKRRLVSQLVVLGLPVEPRESADEAADASAAASGDAPAEPRPGLAFDLLRAAPGGPAVMTGHDDGLITINVEEADDAVREQTRSAMHEPYRTLLGHFRHEVGHYYWDRLVRDSGWLEPWRARFGDEREDYAAALKRHYEQGPAADWPQRCVSAYASTHPWEDWAETWAHYLHMVDTMDTALSFGLDAEAVEIVTAPFGADALDAPDAPGAQGFLAFVNAWVDLTAALNEMARSMGLADFYPFVLSKPAVAKLHFVHRLVQAWREAPVLAGGAGKVS